MAIEQEGLVRWHRGEYDRAQALFEHALRDAARVGHPRGVIHASNDLAGLHYELGQYAIAFERVRQGLEAAEEIGYRPAIGWMIGNAGELYRHHGDMRLAHACYATAIALMSELRDWRVLLINVGNLGVALAAQGDWDRAKKLLGHAVRLARTIENPYHLCEFAYHQARVLAEQDEYRQAAGLNDEAHALAEQIERRDVLLPTELLAVRLRVVSGALTPSAAGRELDALTSRWPEPREQAAIEFERWRSGAGGEKARRRASELHRILHTQHPDVEHAATVGIPHPLKGERPFAAVQLRPGASATSDDILAWARERIAPYKCPRGIVVISDMPFTFSMKPKRREVRERLIRDLPESVKAGE